MPLIIPGKRNLTSEAFTAFFLGQQENRIREEQRRRQEEAADAGGGGVGAGIGAVVGSFIPGVGPVIGAGIGQVAGTLIDPPGEGFAGGSSAQLSQGLLTTAQGISGNLQRERDVEMSEDAKDEAFLTGLQDQFGPNAIKTFNTFSETQLAENPGMSRSDVRQAFNVANAGQFQQSVQDVTRGHELAKRLGKEDANKIQVMKANWADPSQAFQLDGHQLAEINQIKTDLAATGREETTQQVSGPMASQRRAELFRQRDTLARKSTLRPPQVISVEQMARDKKPLQRGPTYTHEGLPGSVVSVTNGGVPSSIFTPGTIVPDKTGSKRRDQVDAKGNVSFHSYQRPDGKWYTQSDTYTEPGFDGLYHYDENGHPTLVKGTETEQDETAKAILKLAESAAKADDDLTIIQALPKARVAIRKAEFEGNLLGKEITNVQERRARQERQDKINKALEQAETLDGFIEILSLDNKVLPEALRLIDNPQNFPQESVLKAGTEIGRALAPFIDPESAEPKLSPRILQQLDALLRRARRVMLEETQPVPGGLGQVQP